MSHTISTFQTVRIDINKCIYLGETMDQFAHYSKNVSVSFVIPAYNEAKTVEQSLRNLYVAVSKISQISSVQFIVVESNSNDGTREIIQGLCDELKLTLILQNEPRGKGNAVREGLEQITNDVVIIYDADDEYDPNDIGLLLEPICAGKTSFVLGTRHSKGGMRVFADAPFTAFVMNSAHNVFTFLFNVTYGTKLTDPFTMYKVFRKSAIEGVFFEAQRFDFDWELVAKILRNGSDVIEVPISYISRHFSEGKKVRFIRDPLSWLVALIKYRFAPLRKNTPII